MTYSLTPVEWLLSKSRKISVAKDVKERKRVPHWLECILVQPLWMFLSVEKNTMHQSSMPGEDFKNM